MNEEQYFNKEEQKDKSKISSREREFFRIFKVYIRWWEGFGKGTNVSGGDANLYKYYIVGSAIPGEQRLLYL